jgi:hypothetical protein
MGDERRTTAGDGVGGELAEAMGWEWTVSCTRLNTGRGREVRRIAGARRRAIGGGSARPALASTSSRPRWSTRETPSLSTAATFSLVVLASWGADPLGPRTPTARAIAAAPAAASAVTAANSGRRNDTRTRRRSSGATSLLGPAVNSTGSDAGACTASWIAADRSPQKVGGARRRLRRRSRHARLRTRH